MANSINEISRLVKRVILTNLGTQDGERLTPLVSGPHGIGKSQVVRQAAKDLGGYPITIEASMLSEGDVVGLPIVSKTSDGTSEVTFVPHKAFAAVRRLEREYFEIAKTKGFLGGTIKVDENGNTVRLVKDEKTGKEIYQTVGARDLAKRVLDGDDNEFKFGESLEFEEKLRLIESGEIKPVVVFIDELNRTDNQTMKELMNVILNATANGYELPWWCFIVAAINPSSQNSSYATNEMDGAQLDRFIKFVATAKTEDWVDFCLERDAHIDLVQAVAVGGNDLLMTKDQSLMDETQMSPSPRSWSMISSFMKYMEMINNTKFFTSEERSMLKDDFREVVNAKVGPTAGRSMMVNLENKKNMVKPEQIINGSAATIDEDIKKILDAQKSIQRKITADSVLRYLAETVEKFEAYKNKNDVKDRAKWTNYGSQLKQYLVELDSATRTVFLKKVIVPTVKTQSGAMLFTKVAGFFSDDMLKCIKAFAEDRKSI